MKTDVIQRLRNQFDGLSRQVPGEEIEFQHSGSHIEWSRQTSDTERTKPFARVVQRKNQFALVPEELTRADELKIAQCVAIRADQDMLSIVDDVAGFLIMIRIAPPTQFRSTLTKCHPRSLRSQLNGCGQTTESAANDDNIIHWKEDAYAWLRDRRSAASPNISQR